MVKNSLILFLFFILSRQLCFAMEVITSADQGMQAIVAWQDVTKFLGTMVAYTTKSSYFKQADKNPINSDLSLAYGYIERYCEMLIWDNPDSREVGYVMVRLLKPKDPIGYCFLTASNLKDAFLFFRSTTSEEQEKILQAISKGKACFENVEDPGEAYAMVSGKEIVEEYKKSLIKLWA